MLAETHVGAGGAAHTRGVPAQTPVVHESPVVQAFPSSHDAPSAYAYEHEPFAHVPVFAKHTDGGDELHAVAHPPQWLGSVLVSTQAPPHASRPPGQPHTLFWQTPPLAQTVAQLPQ